MGSGTLRLLPLVFLSCSAIVSGSLSARVVLDGNPDQIYHGAISMDFLEDVAGDLQFEQVEKQTGWQHYSSSIGLSPNFGFSRSVYWVRIQVENRLPIEDWLVQIGYASLDRMDLYHRDQAGALNVSTAGDTFPFFDRAFVHQTFLFPVRLPRGQTTDLYMRFQTEGAHEYPINILTRDSLWQKDRFEMLAHGLYFGIIAILGIYNLVLFFMVLDRSFLYYFLYITGFGLILLILDGFAFELLWPSFPWWQNRSLPFSIGWTFFWSLAFASKFLKTRSLSPRSHRLIRGLMGAMVVLTIMSLRAPYYWSINMSGLLVIAFSVVVLIASVHSLSRGFRPALYFLMAWVTLLFGVAIYSLKGFGILPAHFLTEYSLQIGSAVEMSLLSLGLGNRMQTLGLERERALGAASEARRLFQEAELRSSRLELELLKKNIEPHFLMNSLNATVFLLEENPAAASSLLDNLASELRILLSVSGRPLIDLERELELCRTHLDVMALRQDAHFTFSVAGTAQGKVIPPLILHTLVENGITHGFKGRDSGNFRLRVEEKPMLVCYTLENDGERSRSTSAEGLGFRYIRARLEEAFPGRWEFRSGPVDSGWSSIIRIRSDAAGSGRFAAPMQEEGTVCES